MDSQTTSTRRLMIGLDVGSTTVKAVVVDPVTDEILWDDYRRHETKQGEVVLEFLKQIKEKFPVPDSDIRVFVTGSGGSNMGKHIGAKFVQEVNAVSLAVEKLYPETGSVIELGGQDAKMIFFRKDEDTGKKKKIPTMNDKCAGGTGAVIDKINAKLGIPAEELCQQGHNGVKIHHIAGKCGVFAETDVNTLQKQSIPVDEIMASLFDSIIGQNVSVLTRGNTLSPTVLLLGGPNTYIKGMVEAWRHHIPRIWEERKVKVPNKPIEELIVVPKNAQLFAAIGAVEFGKDEDDEVGVFKGIQPLEYYLSVGREEELKAKLAAGGGGLSETPEELEAFKEKYKPHQFVPAVFEKGATIRGFIGIDGGSTSTKAVLLDENKEILTKSYQLSKGNPIQDTIDVIGKVRENVESQGAKLEIMGVGTTGYAKDVLKDALNADVALVETVAHTEAALHYYPDVDVICDVGGQDIKVIILHEGRVKDFKLNTQCSAGNGYFLQSTAAGFGHAVEEFADIAFSADQMPSFGYGCAVFMQSDIVDFQRQGWAPKEIMAGLADVLPKNIWLYVCQIPNLAKLGNNFVLQGGTQRNMAAVKSQVDFINSRFNAGGRKPRVDVHKHTGESGAIGAAIESVRLYKNGRRTSFVGLDAVAGIEYKTSTDERTRCYFCKNKCLRTFIDIKKQSQEEEEEKTTFKSKIPLDDGMSRIIIATCEKGTVEDVNAMRGIKAGLDKMKKANPNFVHDAGTDIWKPVHPESVAEAIPEKTHNDAQRIRKNQMKKRSEIRIGIPRVLNQYSTNPFFSSYFESLGLKPENLVYSDYTDEKLYKEGAKRGAIDPCFPSKLGIPHVHNLLYTHHKKQKLDYVFFPMIDCLPTFLEFTVATRSCPTVATTPEAVKAAFIKESDVFKDFGVEYLPTFLNMSEKPLLIKQMYDQFKDILGLSKEENEKAVSQGLEVLEEFYVKLRNEAREVLDDLEKENRIGLVMLGRPYHNDPGINHEILEEFQKLGYPVFTQDSLPIDDDILERLFGEEVRRGDIKSPLDISDSWKNAYSENTNRKVWAAKFTARHPNLVALELSNFKCGHDAPIYTVIEETVEKSGTPYFSFKDVDENKPTGSIKIRVETIHYFLTRYTEDLKKGKANKDELERRLYALETSLRKELGLSVPTPESEKAAQEPTGLVTLPSLSGPAPAAATLPSASPPGSAEPSSEENPRQAVA